MATFDAAGISPTDLEGWVERVEQVFVGALGQDLSLAPETPQAQLIGALALALAQADELAVHVAAGLYLPAAAGQQLDDYGALLSIARRPARRTRVDVTLTGTPTATVPAGTRARADSGAEFQLRAAVLLGADGTGAGVMEAVDAGPAAVAAGDLSALVDVVPGLDSVANAAAGTPGAYEESDADWRERYARLLALSARDGLEAIRARLLLVDGVAAAKVVDNPTAAAVTMQGAAVPARAVMPIVQGGAPADIAAALRAVVPVGTALAGSTSQEIASPSGNSVMRWQPVELVPVAVTVALTADAAFPSGGEALIKERLAAWFGGGWLPDAPAIADQSGVDIGEGVEVGRLYAPVLSVPGCTPTAITVAVAAGGAALPAVTPLARRYTLTAADVTVTIA